MGDDRVIGSIKKNATEQLQVALTEYEGHKLVDVRVHFETSTGSGEWKPTKKGVTFARRLLPEVTELLRQAHDQADNPLHDATSSQADDQEASGDDPFAGE